MPKKQLYRTKNAKLCKQSLIKKYALSLTKTKHAVQATKELAFEANAIYCKAFDVGVAKICCTQDVNTTVV